MDSTIKLLPLKFICHKVYIEIISTNFDVTSVIKNSILHNFIDYGRGV